MDAGRQRASNDKVLDGDLIANRNSSAKHKKGSVTENKRLFLPVPREYSNPRDCSIAGRERRARVQSTRVQPPRINSIVPMQPVCGGASRITNERSLISVINRKRRERELALPAI